MCTILNNDKIMRFGKCSYFINLSRNSQCMLYDNNTSFTGNFFSGIFYIKIQSRININIYRHSAYPQNSIWNSDTGKGLYQDLISFSYIKCFEYRKQC